MTYKSLKYLLILSHAYLKLMTLEEFKSKVRGTFL